MADLVFARPDGQWFDFSPLEMAGMAGNRLVRPTKLDLIPLPEGATLTMMPLSAPIGVDKENGEFLELEFNPYKKKDEPIYALAALLPQGFTRLLLPAASPAQKQLPLLGYTAVGVDKGRLMVAAQKTDEHEHWHPKHYNTPELAGLVAKRKKELPGNQIIEQLAHCALEYGCFTAQNIIYRRYEGGIPVSPVCNADCIGCISLQPAECCPSPQQRIQQAPTVAEIVAVAVPHLAQAKDAIVSFGQGCEGEPSLEYRRICEALPQIRAKTKQGVININTNAGQVEAMRSLIEAGLDSMRVSIFSPLAEEYAAYHRPRGYGLAEVVESLRLAQKADCAASLNLLAYPGFTDDQRRLEALIALVRETGVRQIQLRNLNIDPQVMQPFCEDSWGIGMRNLVRRLQEELPEVQVGNYSRDLRQK